MVENFVGSHEPSVEEVTTLLRQSRERSRRKPWFPEYDKKNLIPFAHLDEIGRANYGENWKRYLTTQSRDFSRNPSPIEDRNIALGCLVVVTLEGDVGTLTHVLDSADSEGVLDYLCALHGHRKGVPTILVGGRYGISEELIGRLRNGLQDEGYVIVDDNIMGNRFGRIATLRGDTRDVLVKRRDNDTGQIKEIVLPF